MRMFRSRKLYNLRVCARNGFPLETCRTFIQFFEFSQNAQLTNDYTRICVFRDKMRFIFLSFLH